MNRATGTISVIIPTHNRHPALRRLIDSLSAQSYPLQHIEVLVVADGCTDGTVEMLRSYRAPFAMQVIEQPVRGAAAARNHGAALAKGWLLIFLDDDIEPSPHLVEAHVRPHQRRPGQVVIGYLPPVPHTSSGLLRIELLRWWEAMFRAMRQPGHRYVYRDLLSGNFSLEAEMFARVGGFDPAFRSCYDDYELGVRLLKAGVLFTFAPNAWGYHHETRNIDRLLQRKYQEGIAEILMGRRHPELRPTLLMTHLEAYGSRGVRLLRTLAFNWPSTGNALIACFPRVLELLEWAGLRNTWRRLLDALFVYSYWCGVAQELGTRRALADFLHNCPISHNGNDQEVELDLSEGLEAVERRLDEEGPVGACIRYGPRPVGRIPATPGAERLRGIHLRPMLANLLAVPLLQALALEGAITTCATVDRLKLSESIRSKLLGVGIERNLWRDTDSTPGMGKSFRGGYRSGSRAEVCP